jgi:hypothetical protein
MSRSTRSIALDVKKTPATSEPIRLIVRRGATKRAEALAAKTAGLNVQISIDRREGERRQSAGTGPVERRGSDRRRQPPFTWDAADFAVVVPKSADAPNAGTNDDDTD